MSVRVGVCVRRSFWVAVGVGAISAGVTVARAFDPGLLAVHSRSSASVLESSAAMAALLLACLAYGRWRQRGLLADLWVCYGISIIAAGKLVFVIAPVLAGMAQTDTLRSAALIAGVCGAFFLLLGASVSWSTTATARRPMLDLTAVLAVVFVLSVGIGVVGHLAGGAFSGLPNFVSTEATGDRGDVAITMLQLVSAAIFAGTAALLVVRRPPPDDHFFGWLAVAATLWALARINYVVTPGRLSSAVTVGDWLRLAAYGVLLVGAIRELKAYWARLAEVAVLEERRKMARDLHDGLAQELAFIATQSAVLAQRGDATPRMKLLRSSAERALDESRRAIAALTRPTDEPIAVTLAQTAEEVAGRLGARIHLDLEEQIRLDSVSRETLVRITREAVTNAVRHGDAGTVTVRLADHDGVLLEVLDNGCGFDPDDLDHRAGRLGLQSMEERAESIGAAFELTSRPHGGTAVRVRLP